MGFLKFAAVTKLHGHLVINIAKIKNRMQRTECKFCETICYFSQKYLSQLLVRCTFSFSADSKKHLLEEIHISFLYYIVYPFWRENKWNATNSWQKMPFRLHGTVGKQFQNNGLTFQNDMKTKDSTQQKCLCFSYVVYLVVHVYFVIFYRTLTS